MEQKFETQNNQLVLTEEVKNTLNHQYFVSRDCYHADFAQVIGFSPKKVRVVSVESTYVSQGLDGGKVRMSGEHTNNKGTVNMQWSDLGTADARHGLFFRWQGKRYWWMSNPAEEFDYVNY